MNVFDEQESIELPEGTENSTEASMPDEALAVDEADVSEDSLQEDSPGASAASSEADTSLDAGFESEPQVEMDVEEATDAEAEQTPAASMEETPTVELMAEEEATSDQPTDGTQAEVAETEEASVEAELEAVTSLEVKEGEEESTELEGEEPFEEEGEDDGREWYVVHCYSGYENKVRHNLEQRIESMGMKDLIFDVVVPTEEEIEVKDGKRRSVERRVFPGYILVNMILTEESWYVVRNTPGVTSFVGMGNEPVPLRPEEVSQIIKRMEADAPRIKVTFKSGERVRIIDGPFNDFRGTVDEIDMERAKVRVMVNFFGRETPVELDFLQVEKA